MSSLKDKVIIITGAVGNLGHAVAERVQSAGRQDGAGGPLQRSPAENLG